MRFVLRASWGYACMTQNTQPCVTLASLFPVELLTGHGGQEVCYPRIFEGPGDHDLESRKDP